MRKRCLALLLAVLLLGSLAAPALASGSEPVTSTGTFWQAAAADSPRVIGNLIGIFSKGTCAVSEDRRHHGKVIRKADPVFGEPGAWLALCDYCGENFKVYDDDMQSAYDEHVGQMQTDYGATSINASGQFILYLDGWTYSSSEPGNTVLATKSEYPYYQFATGGKYLGIVRMTSSRVKVPVTGTYTFCFPSFNVGAVSSNSVFVRFYVYSSATDSASKQKEFYSSDMQAAGTEGYLMASFDLVGGTDAFEYYVYCGFCEKYQGSVTPGLIFTWYTHARPYLAFESALVGDISIDSRVGTFSGNFGYYGDNGQLVVAENIQIVNEGYNTFYNPATGATSPITDWTYDYSDRSYHLTLEGGDTVTVTYGDENVTINQGGDTYNIYYIVPGGGEVEPTPPPTDPPTPTESVTPTDPPGPTEPVDPDAPPDTTGWGILDFLKGIFDFLWGLGEKLMNLLKNLLMLLFMPKEESIKELEDKVAEKLPFISDLQDFGDQFSDVLHNPAKSARSMKFTTVVDLGRKTSGVSYGSGQANMLDMTWYLEYKPLVDEIIEGVAWLVFLWNLYGALPAIIHGGASGVHTTAGLVKWKEENDDVR